jgi:hypothetical protein
MIQPLLSCCESIDTDLSVFVNSEESEFYVYLGVALLERVSLSPENIAHKMLIGRLYNSGAKLSLLRERFNHDPRTIKKWANALKSCDVDEISRAFSGRQASLKRTPELINYVCQQYRLRSFLGRSYREKIIIGVEEIFRVSISPSLVSNIYHSQTIAPEQVSDIVENRVITEYSDNNSASNNGLIVQRSPCFLSGKSYIDFRTLLNTHHIYNEVFQQNTDPFHLIFISIFSEDFKRMCILRNYVAHESKEAKYKYQNSLLAAYAINIFIEPNDFLLKRKSRRDATTFYSYWIELYKSKRKIDDNLRIYS